jgi:hypothetical protein
MKLSRPTRLQFNLLQSATTSFNQLASRRSRQNMPDTAKEAGNEQAKNRLSRPKPNTFQ